MKAHEHGIATVSVAIDKTMLLIGAEIPGDGVFGFEHLPRTDTEKRTIADAMAILKDKVPELFVLPPELGCKVGDVRIEAPQAEAKPAAPVKADGGEEHMDVDADYTMSCQKSPAGSTMKLGLLKLFPRIKRIKLQVLSDATQSGRDVQSDQDPVKL